jgi:undecaprenyl-diphosphatase
VKSPDGELSYLQAIITGVLQGISELFPISSLGHSVLVPAWIGGSWEKFLSSETSGESPYLLLIIALHVASSLVLIWFFRDRWLLLIKAFFASLPKIGKRKRLANAESLIWKILIATIPVGILGVLFQEEVAELFSDPLAVAIFLFLNGAILASIEIFKKYRIKRELPDSHEISNGQAFMVGVAQSAALFPGISRFGITMSAGLVRGLSHAAASDFAFLIAAPVIFGAGILKLPRLFDPEIQHILGPVLVGSLISAICTYLSIAFLVRWFKTHTLYPFAFYSLIIGLLSVWKFA